MLKTYPISVFKPQEARMRSFSLHLKENAFLHKRRLCSFSPDFVFFNDLARPL